MRPSVLSAGGAQESFLEPSLRYSIFMVAGAAEEEGFEPPALACDGFQDRCLKPLGHSSSTRSRKSVKYRNARVGVKAFFLPLQAPGRIRSKPVYGRNASGISTEPSSFWPCSR